MVIAYEGMDEDESKGSSRGDDPVMNRPQIIFCAGLLAGLALRLEAGLGAGPLKITFDLGNLTDADATASAQEEA